MDQTESLETVIRHYVPQGYRVISKTATTAQLVKPKQFSFLVAIILLLLFFVPFVVYLLYYLSQKDATIYIEVFADGSIAITDNFGKITKYKDVNSPAVIPISDEQARQSTNYGLMVIAALVIISGLVWIILQNI